MDIKRIEKKCGLIPSSSSESEDLTTINGSEQSLESIMEEEPDEFEVSEEESLQELQNEFNDKTNLENDIFTGKIGKNLKTLILNPPYKIKEKINRKYRSTDGKSK